MIEGVGAEEVVPMTETGGPTSLGANDGRDGGSRKEKDRECDNAGEVEANSKGLTGRARDAVDQEQVGTGAGGAGASSAKSSGTLHFFPLAAAAFKAGDPLDLAAPAFADDGGSGGFGIAVGVFAARASMALSQAQYLHRVRGWCSRENTRGWRLNTSGTTPTNV
jgi:hypothetical protein